MLKKQGGGPSTIYKISSPLSILLFLFLKKNYLGLPGVSAIKNAPAVQETQEMRVQFLGWEDPLEEGMATHSSILALRIPWTGAWRATAHSVAKSGHD